MKPIKFKGVNVTFAENQSEYKPLPAFMSEAGEVVTCWKFTFWERLKLLFTGKLFMVTGTFNQPLQPVSFDLDNPLIFPKDEK
jgi:hypothetical protein